MAKRYAYLLLGFLTGYVCRFLLWILTGKFNVRASLLMGNFLGFLFIVRAERSGNLKRLKKSIGP